MSSIPAFRATYQCNNTIDIVKDVIALTYSSDSGQYEISFNLITRQGKVISMGWSIDLPFTIPEALRKEAKANAGRPVALYETIW